MTTAVTDKQLIADRTVSFYVGEHREAEPMGSCDGPGHIAPALHRYEDPLTGLSLDFCSPCSHEFGPELDNLGWPIVMVAK